MIELVNRITAETQLNLDRVSGGGIRALDVETTPERIRHIWQKTVTMRNSSDLSLILTYASYGNKVETWKFKATESADRVQMIIYWLMASGYNRF